MKNILPILNYPEEISQQSALGIISSLVSQDHNINLNWNISDLYRTMASSIKQGNFYIEYNTQGQPHKAICWDKKGKDYPSLKAAPFKKEEGAPVKHIDLRIYEFYRYIGSVFTILSFSDYHHTIQIEYLQREIIPAALYQQLIVYYNEDGAPWGFFTWAKLSSEKERDIHQKKNSLAFTDWNCGERLFVNDLAAPWGGVRYIIRDMRERLFPFNNNSTGIRRKSNKKQVISQNFKVLRPKINISNKLKTSIEKFHIQPITFQQFQKIVSELDEFKSHYELAVLLDQNSKIAEQELTIANNFYCKHIEEIKKTLKNTQADTNKKITNYLLIDAQTKKKGENFTIKNRLTSAESNSFYEITKTIKKKKKYNKLKLIDNNQISYTDVLSIFSEAISFYLPKLTLIVNQVIKKTQLDLRYTIDKIERPFFKQRGEKMPPYISVPFTGDAIDSINLVHEYSHALLFSSNIQYKGYLFTEDRPLINEVFAFLGEYLYCNHLKKIKHTQYINISMAEIHQDNFYLNECLPSLQKVIVGKTDELSDIDVYSAVYPIARKLAYTLAKSIIKGNEKHIKLVEQMSLEGSEFNINKLLIVNRS